MRGTLKDYYNALLATGRTRSLSISEAQADLDNERAINAATLTFVRF